MNTINNQAVASLVEAANKELADPERNRLVPGGDSRPPRFELYHAGLSICSQKVRAVLAEKGAAYLSHEMVILNSKGIYSEGLTPAENYRPGYVRLRMHGGKALNKNYADKHTGRSSVDSEGFDPCVVPTLVDHELPVVVADSKRICAHLDREISESIPLMPEDEAASRAVSEQVAIVDRTPHPAVLYGFHPDDDRRPDFIKHVMSDVYDLKVEALEALIKQNSADADLVAAYRSKIAKELAGKQLARDDNVQHAVRAEMKDIIDNLDRQLASTPGPWVCGSDFTMADVVWGVSLYRLHWLGLAYLWNDLARVREYTGRVYNRPSIREAVINFPSPMPPSPHTMDVI